MSQDGTKIKVNLGNFSLRTSPHPMPVISRRAIHKTCRNEESGLTRLSNPRGNAY